MPLIRPRNSAVLAILLMSLMSCAAPVEYDGLEPYDEVEPYDEPEYDETPPWFELPNELSI